MFKNLKQKLESVKVESTSTSSDCDSTECVSTDKQIDDESRSNNRVESRSEDKKGNKSEPRAAIKPSFSSQDISNNLKESNFASSSLRPNSMSSVTLDESSLKLDDRKKLLWENERLREQVRELSRKLETSTNVKQVGDIDEKLLKLVGESIVKESNEHPKEVNGAKSTYGNWSFLLPPSNKDDIDNSDSDLHKQEIDKLQRRIDELEESLRDKNKTIRLQQQRLIDIKKSFQRGPTLDNKLFDIPGSQNEIDTTINDGSSRALTISRSENGFDDQQEQKQHKCQLSDSQTSLNYLMNDISFQYLRSVVFKFVLTSDYEAQKHLIKAISMLLKFSEAEERQIRESLEQKVSWFKNLPLLGNGFKLNSHSQLNNSTFH